MNAKKIGKKSHGKYDGKIAYFCVPADFKKETLVRLADLNRKYRNGKVEEVYGSLPDTIYGSGRSSGCIPKVKLLELKEYVKECNKCGIVFNYTLNTTTLCNREFNNKEKENMLSFIKKLHDIGVKRFTVTLPSLISLINNNFGDIEIVLSVINNIRTEYELKEFLDAGTVIRAYVSEEMNRKPHELKRIVSGSKVPIATIVNAFCLFQCAYRFHHYNFAAFRNKDDNCDLEEYYQLRCEGIKANYPEEVVKIPWIRPCDIDRYINIGINYFKIVGREMVMFGSDIPATAEAYMARSKDCDLIELFNGFSDLRKGIYLPLKSKLFDPFFDYIFSKPLDCSRDQCDNCSMCKKYSKYVSVSKDAIEKMAKFKTLK